MPGGCARFRVNGAITTRLDKANGPSRKASKSFVGTHVDGPDLEGASSTMPYKRHWPGFDSHLVSSAAESAGLKHAA